MSPATALVPARPGDRLLPRAWMGLGSVLAALALTAVTIPTLSALYGVVVPLAFVVGAAHGTALVLAPHRPVPAVLASLGSVLAVGLLATGGDGLPWPVPVATLITQVILCLLVALHGDLRLATGTLLGSAAVAGVPLVRALGDAGLWSGAAGNLLTFGCLALLVTAAGLALSLVLPESSEPGPRQRLR